MASSISFSGNKLAEMSSVSRHCTVRAILVDLKEEYRPDEEPLQADVTISDLIAHPRTTKKCSPKRRGVICISVEFEELQFIIVLL